MEFQEKFLAHGIDINDPTFTRWVPEAAQKNILRRGNSPTNPGGEWNQRWREFWADVGADLRPSTREETIRFMNELKTSREFAIP